MLYFCSGTLKIDRKVDLYVYDLLRFCSGRPNIDRKVYFYVYDLLYFCSDVTNRDRNTILLTVYCFSRAFEISPEATLHLLSPFGFQ